MPLRLGDGGDQAVGVDALEVVEASTAGRTTRRAEHGDGRDERRDVEGAVDRRQAALAGARPGDEDADDRGDGTDGRHDQREDEALLAEGDGAEDQRGHQRDGVGLEQVGRHAGAVADVVADVVGDRGGVARVVLGDALLDLADEVGADVGGLGEDAAADTHEHGEQRGAEAEALEHGGRFALVDQHDRGRAEEAETDGQHADGPPVRNAMRIAGSRPSFWAAAATRTLARVGEPHAEVADERPRSRRRARRTSDRPILIFQSVRRGGSRAAAERERQDDEDARGCGTGGSGTPKRPPGRRSPISCIFSVPSPALSTSARNTTARMSARTATPATADTIVRVRRPRGRCLRLPQLRSR